MAKRYLAIINRILTFSIKFVKCFPLDFFPQNNIVSHIVSERVIQVSFKSQYSTVPNTLILGDNSTEVVYSNPTLSARFADSLQYI